MEPPNRFAVPADDLDAVRVDHADQVEENKEARPPDISNWAGRLTPAFGDGGGGSCDGDGE